MNPVQDGAGRRMWSVADFAKFIIFYDRTKTVPAILNSLIFVFIVLWNNPLSII
jgi:hypothetical protein